MLTRLSGETALYQPYRKLELHNFRVMTLVLGRHVLAWDPDCILTFLLNTNLLGLLARAWYGFQTPLICSDHNHLNSELQNLPWPSLRHFFITRHYPQTNRHLAVAPESAETIVEQIHPHVLAFGEDEDSHYETHRRRAVSMGPRGRGRSVL